MNRFLTGLFFVALTFIVLVAWGLSSSTYRTEEAQEKFYEIAKERVNSTAEATTEYTDAPEVTEATTEKLAETAVATEEQPAEVTEAAENTVLLFGGDLNLDRDYGGFAGEGSAAACIDASLLSEMTSADIFMHGNLFAITDGSTPADKAYVFDTSVADAAVLRELGTDVVSLANNHSLDHGEDGLRDTVAALEAMNIGHVGAGENKAEAEKAYIITVGGKKIAFTAAMRSEKYPKTPEATEDECGVVKMYDIESYLEIIRTAKANADIVVAYAHWGSENTIWLEQEQIDGAHALIDAGADVVVGAHSHTLQTAEIYKGKPIFYGLGDMQGEGGLAKVTYSADGMDACIIPFGYTDGITVPLSGDALRDKLAELDFVSATSVDENGRLSE